MSSLIQQLSAHEQKRIDCTSPEYNTARSHQSVVLGDRGQYPRLDSSEDSPSLHSDIFDAQFWQSEDAAFDDALASSDSSGSLKADVGNDEGCWMTDGAFKEQIRPHGIPLDPITERSSLATLPFEEAIWSDQAASRKSSAPAVLSGLTGGWNARGTSRSLDERPSPRAGRSFSLNAISEASNLWSDFDAVLAVSPVKDPIERIPTPTGLPRWPADLPRDIRGSPPTRRTSSYVRDMYQRLVGGQSDSNSITVCGGTQSRIPVPERLARGGRTGSGYWHPPNSTHTMPKFAECPPPQSVSPRRRRLRAPVTNENAVPPKAIPKRLSGLLKRASRLFDQQRSASTASLSVDQTGVHVPGEYNDIGSDRPQGQLLAVPLSTSRLSLQEQPKPSPAKSYTTSMLTPEPLTIRPRSRGKRRSPGTPEAKSLPTTPNGSGAAARMTKGFLFPSPKSEQSASSCRSWDLPLTPLPFPKPPSPNIYSTARDRQIIHMVPNSERSTNDGIPLFPSNSASLREYDVATDAEALNSIRASWSSSTSSSSFVAGRSYHLPANHDQALASDVFVSRPTLRVTNPSDEPGGVHEIDLSTSSEAPSTPVHMPSPLRPRMRSNKQYRLFPDTTSHEAQLPPFAPGMPIVRAWRSVSSHLRALGAQPVKIITTVEHDARAIDGAGSINRDVFAHPLERVENQREQQSRIERRITRKEKVQKPFRDIAGWVPSCFCQPVADDESIMGGHVRAAEPVRMTGSRRIVE